MTQRVQATVSGQVQGVGYRYFAVHVAHRIGVQGSVRNTQAGDVEVVAEGDEAQITQLLGELRHGPSTASVTNMQVAYGEPTGEFHEFTAEA